MATRLACAISLCISRYCRSRRVLSKAMVAGAAKSLNKEICLSVNGCTRVRDRVIVPTTSLSLSNGTTNPFEDLSSSPRSKNNLEQDRLPVPLSRECGWVTCLWLFGLEGSPFLRALGMMTTLDSPKGGLLASQPD